MADDPGRHPQQLVAQPGAAGSAALHVEADQRLQHDGEGAGEQCPHIQTALTPASPEGRGRSPAPSLASRKRSSTSVRRRNQASTPTTSAGVEVGRFVTMKLTA